MMKRILVTGISLALLFASTAFAQPYGSAGCGLGSVIFGNQPGGVQIFAATTNGTFGNQTFGITTGTLNCGDPIWEVGSNEAKQLKHFVAHNMDALALDVARGQGETFDAFAELLRVPAAERSAFAAELQLAFDQVFSSEQVLLAEVIDQAAALKN